jgi:hypothetical protein
MSSSKMNQLLNEESIFMIHGNNSIKTDNDNESVPLKKANDHGKSTQPTTLQS